MSRTMAKHVLNIDECVETMKNLGLKCDTSRFVIDEAKEAYKDIHVVMDNQQDLVDILVEQLPYKTPAIKG